MSFICKLFRKKKKKVRQVIVPTPVTNNTDDEIILQTMLRSYVFEQNGTLLEYDGHLKTFVDDRVGFWEESGFDHEDNLHINVLGDMESYLRFGIFEDMAELANYGITADYEGFINSPKHREILTNGQWKYLAVCMRGKYCNVSLAR